MACIRCYALCQAEAWATQGTGSIPAALLRGLALCIMYPEFMQAGSTTKRTMKKYSITNF